MLVDPVSTYLTVMCPDQGRLFQTASIAGSIACAWRLRIAVSAVVVDIPDLIAINGVVIPIAINTPAPVMCIAGERHPLMDVCALQAASRMAIGRYVWSDGTNAEITDALWEARHLLESFGVDALKLLTRALLLPPYTNVGMHPAPREPLEQAEALTPVVASTSVPRSRDLALSRMNNPGRNGELQ